MEIAHSYSVLHAPRKHSDMIQEVHFTLIFHKQPQTLQHYLKSL